MRRTFLLSCLVLLLFGVSAAAAEKPPELVWPVDGKVGNRFHYKQVTPFLAGQRRTLGIAVRPGSTVRSACSGRVRFAGQTPSRVGAVTVLCGGYVVVHSQLLRVADSLGGWVGVGTQLGTSGAELALSVRLARDRFGYVDPLPLLGQQEPPFGVAPTRRPTQRRPLGRVGQAPNSLPVAESRPVAVHGAARAGAAAAESTWIGWAGVAVLVAAVLVGVARPLRDSLAARGLLRHNTDLLRQR